MKSSLVAAGLLSLACLAAMTACSSSQPAPSSPTGASAPAVVGPSPAAATPSSAKLDTADLKALLVTGKDLGASWGASAGGTGASPWSSIYCPQPDRSTNDVDASARYWQGFFSNTKAKTGGGIVVDLTALPSADGSAVKAAYQADRATCKTFDSQGYYSVDAVETTAVDGADEVIGSYTRRIYGDKAHKQLIMTFKNLACREGSVVVEISAGYPAEVDSPVVKNFDIVKQQMTKQLTKISSDQPS